jgi:hypothetical protein
MADIEKYTSTIIEIRMVLSTEKSKLVERLLNIIKVEKTDLHIEVVLSIQT